MLSGSAAARRYGYSSARARSMDSLLLSGKSMREMMNAKDIGSMVSMLYQGDFKRDIEEFGGLDIRHEMIDFALSKNLAKNVGKLVQISPTTERRQIRAVVGRWSLYNIKMAIEAKAKHQQYEDIARYIIDYGTYNAAAVKEAMREESIESMLGKFMINSPYRDMLSSGLEAYKKTKSIIHTVAEIDRSYYQMLGSVIIGLRVLDNDAARVVKMEVDMANILFMIKARRAGFKFQEIVQNLIGTGNIAMPELEQMYNSSRDIETLVSQIKQYDMKESLEIYRSGKTRQLLVFEIGLRNRIFESSIRLLSHRILSFGAILAYAYKKELEIYTLRILIHARMYGLGKDEVERLMVWKSE